jgi:hypothetical protein
VIFDAVGRCDCCVTLQSSKSSGTEVKKLDFHFFYGIYLHIPMGILTPKTRFDMIRDWLLPIVFVAEEENRFLQEAKEGKKNNFLTITI